MAQLKSTLDDIDIDLASKIFAKLKKKFSEKTGQSLGLYTMYQSKLFPTNGALLLFGKEHARFFPDSIIRLARFLGTTKAEVLDQQDIDSPLVNTIEPIVGIYSKKYRHGCKIWGNPA